MTDFNMPPGVSARDIPGQDEVPDLVEQLQASASRASWPEDTDLMTEAADEITRLRAEVEAKQARIDALMLEHCPDEMTQEQTDNWKAHQRPREG